MASVTTPHLGLTNWTSDNDVPSASEFTANNTQLDSVLSFGYADTAANIVKYQGFPGVRYWATDTMRLYRHNGAAWLPLLSSVDEAVLSTDLPAPSQDGLYYHATDTDQVYRDNGASLIPLIEGLPAQFPVGTIAFYAQPSFSVTTPGTFYVPGASALGPALPAGWAYCDGSALSTTAYPALFSLLGYSYTFTGWQLTAGGASYTFSGSVLPSIAAVVGALSYLGYNSTQDSFNPNLPVSAKKGWTLSPTGTASSGPFSLPYGVCYPQYAYTQSSYYAAELAGQGVPNSLGWPTIALEPAPANPYLIDGCPTGIYAVLIKTS